MAYNRWLSSDELMHHQVKGAHWGVHNGPPYPLDRSKSDGHKLLTKGDSSPQGKKRYKTSEKTAHKRAERKAKTLSSTIEENLNFFQKELGWDDADYLVGEQSYKMSYLADAHRLGEISDKEFAEESSKLVSQAKKEIGRIIAYYDHDPDKVAIAKAALKRFSDYDTKSKKYSDPDFLSLHDRTRESRRKYTEYMNNGPLRVTPELSKKREKESEPLYNQLANDFREERKRLSELDSDYAKLSKEYDDAHEYAKKNYETTPLKDYESWNKASDRKTNSELDLEYYYDTEVKPYMPSKKDIASKSNTTYTSRDAKKANDIFKTLSKQEKFYLTAEENSKRYVSKKEYGQQGSNVFSLIEQYKDTPVSVIDIWKDDRGGADVSIAVRNEERFRHKGYASRALENGIKYFYDHPEIEYLVWGVNSKNRPSIELAKKYGFYLYDKRDDGWDTYTLDQKKR